MFVITGPLISIQHNLMTPVTELTMTTSYLAHSTPDYCYIAHSTLDSLSSSLYSWLLLSCSLYSWLLLYSSLYSWLLLYSSLYSWLLLSSSLYSLLLLSSSLYSWLLQRRELLLQDILQEKRIQGNTGENLACHTYEDQWLVERILHFSNF